MAARPPVGWSTRLAWLATVALACMAEASAQTVTLSPAPGTSESFTLRLINPTSAPIHPAALNVSRNGLAWNLTLSAEAPCTLTGGNSSLGVVYAPIIDANSSLDCTIRVSRNANPLAYNGTWHFFPANGNALQAQPQDLRVGAFADLQFSFGQVAPFPNRGETTTLFRLSATSSADFPIRGAEIGNCGSQEGYVLDVDLPGGCAFAQNTSGVGCPLSMPDNHWILPDIPPHGSSTCLIRLTAPNGLLHGLLEDMWLSPGMSDDGFEVEDVSGGDRSVRLFVVLTDIAIPALGKQSMLLLVAGLLTIGALAFHWRRVRVPKPFPTEE